MIDAPPRRLDTRRTILLGALVVFALAMLMGLPALQGGFVGGDDHRLVLNHVLVNQPSIAHAIELFSIVHRDLYQPLPLLTFQFEFVIAGALGLFDKGVESGAWLFHFDNMWLHGLNALLVGALLLQLQRHDQLLTGREGGADPLIPKSVAPASAARTIAFLAAVLFAVHPLQVEVVAWINGRMMLLSTLFLILAVLAFVRYLDRGGTWTAALCLLLVLLSAISKIRAGLPIILALGALARGHRPGKRFWSIVLPAALIASAFVLVNVWSTSEAALFAGGAERLKGPRPVRVLLALDFYFEHLFWPAGLASFYPTPAEVAWTDAAAIRSIAVVVPAFAALGLFSLKSPAVRWGTLWFLAGIADTLPLVPARNILAADRYMYLPIIGLLWALCTLGHAGYARLKVRMNGQAASLTRACAVVGGIILAAVLLRVCRPVAEQYTTPLAKTKRVAELFPDEPRVWELLGWVYHRTGEYDKAIEAGNRELSHDHPGVRSGAYELIGISYFEKGDWQTGIDFLTKAVQADPQSGSAQYRLGIAYEDLGEFDKAVALLEQAAAMGPKNDPVIRRLAAVYRKQGRMEDARRRYEHVLGNNPYDVEAIIGLVELDIDAGSDDSLQAAERRLGRILADVRSDGRLRQNLAVVRSLREHPAAGLRLAAAAFVALTDGRYGVAVQRVEELASLGDQGREARNWLLQSFERFDGERSGIPWTYGLTARLLIAEEQTEAAGAGLALFRRTCASDPCRQYAAQLADKLARSADPR